VRAKVSSHASGRRASVGREPLTGWASQRPLRKDALRHVQVILDVPEIVECYTVSGDTDFLLRVVVEDVTAYEHLLKRTLVHLPEVGNLSSTFALRQVKYTTELPLHPL
jgi:DNA-binding Lrp family transcriptional regulator